jgi:hypothetical protein
MTHTRRRAIATGCCSGMAMDRPTSLGAARRYLTYVGTYTGPQSKGIYAFRRIDGQNRSFLFR